ncbi:unnamed protein product [Caenorhabditis nigoni]
MSFFLPFLLFLSLVPDSISNTSSHEALLDELNTLRATVADRDRIPNMHKLVYNSSLELLASKPPANFSRSFLIPSLDDSGFISKLRKNVSNGLQERNPDNSNHGNLEALVPLQRQIGCATAGSGYRCVLSPRTDFKLWTPSKSKKAGSDCIRTHKNHDGLCAYVGLQSSFVFRLNKVRSAIANKYGVMEMYEVVSDPAISKLADPSKLTKEVIESLQKMGFGYFKLPTYVVDVKDLEAKVNDFLKLTDSEKETDMKKSDGIRYGELISPPATFFGCHWDEEQKCFHCLIGPVYSIHSWESKPDPRKIIGTDCPAGYKSKKGLCSPVKKDPNYFIHGVNMARRMAAKLFEILAENEVIWKDSLSYIARHCENDTYNELLDSLDKLDLRYSFREDLDAFGQLSIFLVEWTKKPNSEKDEFFKKRFLEDMEFLNPTAEDIGCALHKESKQFLCLISLELGKEFERLDVPYKRTTGSYCHFNWDGLCVSGSYSFLKRVNSFRKDHANSHNITDMHELLWNNELEQIAKSTSWTLSNAPVTKPYRYVVIHSYHLTEQRLKSEMAGLKKLDSSKREILFKKIHGSSLGISELAEPLQKFIGCSSRTKEISNGLLCIIGPREMAQPWRLENRGVRIPGTKKYRPFIPGSNCTAGYSNSEGLCTPINSSTLTLLGNQEDFIKDVNEYRRRLAKEYNTRAMFELYHSKDLETMLSVLDWDVSWPLARVSYRYLRFRSFNSVFDKIPGQFSDLKKLSQKERRVNVYETKTSAGYLELLEPQQHLIACALKKSKNYPFEGSEEFVVCALGPMGEMEMWGLTEIFHTNLAAACGDSSHFYQRSGLPQKFVPNDGLCSKTPDTKLSYFGNRRFFMEQANLVRKDRARRYALPRFMKLLWDSDLVEEAKKLPFDSANPPQLTDKPFRWFKIPHYHFHADDIKGEFFDRITYADKAKMAEWIEKMKPTSIGILELFGEGQEKIGCTRRNTSAEMFYLCLLGPEPRFTLIPLEKEYKRGLPKKEGRDCPSGTWSDGGLCTPDSEKPVPKKRKRRTTTTTSTRYSTTTAKSKKSSNRPLNIFWNLLAVSIFCDFI